MVVLAQSRARVGDHSYLRLGNRAGTQRCRVGCNVADRFGQPKERAVSSAEATATAAGAAESADGGEAAGIPSVQEAVVGLAVAFSQGLTVAREAGRLALEFTRIARGVSSVAPAQGGRRFNDPASTSNPVFRMIQQRYLASAGALDRVVDQLGDGQNDPRAERARFTATILTSAAAPTNFLVSNPAAIKRTIDTGGLSLVRGIRNLVSDARHNGGRPSMVEPRRVVLGPGPAVGPRARLPPRPACEGPRHAPPPPQRTRH